MLDVRERRDSSHHPLHSQHLTEAHIASSRLKRRSPIVITDLEDTVKAASPRAHIDAIRPSSFKAKQSKRVRINWSQSENDVFFDTIQKFATEDESTVLKEIVAALNGSRNWVQCKGHFRNLQYVGRITQTNTHPKRWVVVEQSKSQKPSSSGGGGGSSGGGASASAGGLASPGSTGVDNMPAPSSGKGPSSSGEKNPGISGHDDDDASHAQNFSRNGALQPQIEDFEQTSGIASGVASATDTEGVAEKPSELHSQEVREQITIHDDHDMDEDEMVEDHDEYDALGKDSDERMDNNLSNGHVLRGDSKSLRGMMAGNRESVNVDLGMVSITCTTGKSEQRNEADQSETPDEELPDMNCVSVEKAYESRDMAMPLKKQTSSATGVRGISLQTRSTADRRRYTDIRPTPNSHA